MVCREVARSARSVQERREGSWRTSYTHDYGCNECSGNCYDEAEALGGLGVNQPVMASVKVYTY